MQLPKVPIRRGRIVALIVAAAMLNVGLYFLLDIFTPLVSGMIVGFLVSRPKEGALFSFLGSLFSFLPMLLVAVPAYIDNQISIGQILASELTVMLPWIYTLFVISGLILSLIGLVGGFIGGYLGRQFLR
ncbi:MAG: DUF5518 domain-containing protein [Candidatus Thorarchaeota archaeon]|nr:DUF5518 domain-containing protein [Candidatus Thorarchaeota archaeon]MCK5238904.1 DUF5518 domain-containing protein [Candidatus Thorarchaeota archaeon]